MLRVLSMVCGILLCSAAYAQDTATITDGDTVGQDGIIYRLHGIDAPEFAQTCDGVPCGKVATETMAQLAEGRRLDCEARGEDGYGRTIAVCKNGDIDIGAEMVRLGYAWAYVRFSDDYVALEISARDQRTGMWNNNPEPPWVFRERRWDSASTEAPDGCPIKGNISQNGRIYHPPWSPWYSRTRINTSKGERWFCDEGEAVAAGWRAPRWR